MQPVEDLLLSVLFLIFFYCSSKLSITLSCSCFQVRLARQLCVLFSTLWLEEVACFSSNSSAGQACSDDSSAECCLVYGVCTFAQYLQFNELRQKKILMLLPVSGGLSLLLPEFDGRELVIVFRDFISIVSIFRDIFFR